MTDLYNIIIVSGVQNNGSMSVYTRIAKRSREY